MRNITKRGVTPYTGVWIETWLEEDYTGITGVTPYTGVWIETLGIVYLKPYMLVTPYTGVWIETLFATGTYKGLKSHPTRVCGLKPQLR